MSNWIKCSERLPEVMGELKMSHSILLYGQEDVFEPFCIFIGYMIEGNRFYSDNGECENITHWQPLPESPKEK